MAASAPAAAGELLRIEPLELRFPFELKKQILCSMQLSNHSDDFIAFKVKTTSPKKYSVRPNTGVVSPRSTCDVVVTMQAQREAPPDMQCKDKFLVQSVVAPAGTTVKDITAEMFAKESGNKMEKVKLRVTYVAPPQPPSPVPEESEERSPSRVSESENEDGSAGGFTKALRERLEPQEKSLEAGALISKLTEEKNSAMQQNQRLRQELVDTILDKENFTLEELLDEDEIIQECKALNTRLINFLCDKAQVEQLLRYIVEEVPEDSEKKRSFKFPFIACEIFTCEIDIILRTLVEDDGLMGLLFSFVKPDHPHSTLLAGYFSKVVICLMLRKAAPLMNYVQEHPDIVIQLVDLIGITSIMEVLMRLIGADETIYSNFADTLQWLENIDVLEMIVDKFSSSDSPEVHANAAEILSAVTRCAPPSLAAKISSPSFVGRLFRHALEESRPKSVLVHSLSVCISLLDPKRLASASYQAFRSNLSHGTLVTASPETVNGMLESLVELLKLLDITSSENVLPTTYGYLRPPLGKHRLKIVEFISVLLTIGSETAERELISQSAIKHSIDLFFQYPYNNFLHHHVENIVVSCLEAKRNHLIDHVLNDCDFVGKVLAAENSSSLSSASSGQTFPSEGKEPPRIGNIGHITRLANKLIQLGNSNSIIQSHLQENSKWVEWQTDVLAKRNEVENVYHWACGRPTSLHDRGRDSDDDDFRDRDYDVAALANNLSQAFRYGIYSNDDIEEAQGSHERDDEDVYFDDESAEVVISSLRLGDDQDSSLFTNSNWFTFDGDRGINDRLAASVPSSSPNSEETSLNMEAAGEVLTSEGTGTELQLESVCLENGPAEETEESAVDKHTAACTDGDKPLSTDGESSSKEPEASERPVDPQGEQVDTQVVDAAEVSGEEIGGEGTSDKHASTSEPDIALANYVDIGSLSTSAGSDETEHDSGKVLQVEGKTEDSGKGVQVEGDISVEADVEKKSDVVTTKE